MKILSVQQIREADAYNIEHEPIFSIDLMERAAEKCEIWIYNNVNRYGFFKIICGLGNNGGDGLALGWMLKESGYYVEVYIVRYSEQCSADFKINEKRLLDFDKTVIHNVFSKNDFPLFAENDCVIDALFGTGLSKPVEGLAAELIHHINKSGVSVISIDMPSGLFADGHTSSEAVVKAVHTLSFQTPKLAFLFAESQKYVGDWHILDIGLDKRFIEEQPCLNNVITEDFVKPLLKTRNKFSHKGNFGHALLVAGSYGKMGAAVLAAEGCLRGGVGLLTVHVPKSGYNIIQTSVPEAMVTIDFHEKIFTDNLEPKQYSSVGVGPGIGTDEATQTAFKHLLLYDKKAPMVIDADALNILSMNKEWIKLVHPHSILTPHPKEFERLAGKTSNDFERHDLQLEFSAKHKVYVVLKGAYTCITTPEGESYFNSTGNPGMAKGGSGDILTGLLTGLLAQGYSSFEACILGVYIHGLAGDIAAKSFGQDGMIARDIVNALPSAFQKLR